jgi:hypothetical protein
MSEEPEYLNIAERLVRSIAGVSESRMRSVVFFRKLCLLSNEGVVEVLNIIINRANCERGLNSDIIDIFFDQSSVEEFLGKTRLDGLLSVARGKNYSGVVDLFGRKPEKDEDVEIKEERIYDFDEKTIGERKSYAHSTDTDLIAKLIHDPEPVVIERLLQNPRITEREVLKIITKRPVKTDIIKVVANSEKWNSSYTIKDAIARNPYTPIEITLKILPALMKQDLTEISQDGSLDKAIRERAVELLNQKRGRTDEFYLIETLDDSDENQN